MPYNISSTIVNVINRGMYVMACLVAALLAETLNSCAILCGERNRALRRNKVSFGRIMM